MKRITARCGARPARTPALAFDVGIVAFQMSSETHARVANAAKDAAAAKGWKVQVLNSEGSLPKHAQQLDDLIQRKVDAIIVAMGKPVEGEAQLKAAADAKIPVVTVMAGTSAHTLFDIQVNEYKVGAEAALYLLGLLNYQGNILAQRFDGNVGTRIRGKVLDAVLSENTGVKVVASHSMARTQSWRDDVRNGMSALILQNKGKIEGIWASFDGQAYVIDDLLREQGYKKGDVKLVSVDGGAETYRRIADPQSTVLATVMIPFETDGQGGGRRDRHHRGAEEAEDTVTAGPYLYMDACWSTAQRGAVQQVMLLSLRGVGEALRRGRGAARCRSRRRAGRRARHLRRQRRRQVDADPHHLRRAGAERRRDDGARRGGALPLAARRARGRHRDDLPGPRALPAPRDLAERLPRRRADALRPARQGAHARRRGGYLARLGITLPDTDMAVENLSGGQRQAVAISRALRLNAELIVMDEPTAALGVKETAQVLDLIRRLKADGKTIILVSHNMADVVAVASRVAIFKSGRKVIDRATAGLDADALAHMVMTGRDPSP